jgi:hypothetical protein
MAYTDIDKSDDYFTPYLWTGDGAVSRVFTGVGLQADMMWSKIRTSVHQHNIVDTVRGVNQRLISPNSTSAEDTTCTHGYFNSLDADGFTITGTGGNWNVNTSGYTYVGWNWKGGGTAVSNTEGSITSSVSANTTSGFSIVSYTATGANATVGHGLGVAPKMIIVKSRTSVRNWPTYHSGLGSNTNFLYLNDIDASASLANMWNSTTPTSTLFGIGTNVATNANTENYIAYCFADVKGFSKMGSYVGNGSADGTFVYTGFKPAFVMFKRTDTTSNWTMLDTKRSPFNLMKKELYANFNNAEAENGRDIDCLSSGIKIRSSSTEINASGGTYIYMAFAENPFVTSTGIPTPAR